MERTLEETQKLLSDPFPEGDIEWRVQQSGMAKNPWVMVIPYITNRAIQQRLDDIFGFMGWENVFEETKSGKGYLCGLKVKFGDAWVTKWDGAEYTNVEPLKGALSGAMKRVAVQFGIGRYLYNLETVFATCRVIGSRRDTSDNGTYMKIKQKQGADIHAEWFPPALEAWALPSVEFDSLLNEINKAKDLILLKGAFSTAYKFANSFSRGDLVKKAITAKDAQKLKLETESSIENTQEELKIRVWLEQQVNDQILGAQNESVLKINKKTLSAQISEKCLEAGVDVMDLLQVLEKHYQNQLNTLKP